MFKDFKKFAFKGNVLDLAIGVIIGGAFGKIVTSLVNDIIMPAIGMLLGGVSFADLKVVIPSIKEGVADAAIMYGLFIQSVVDFLIIAMSIFLFVKLIERFKKKEEAVVEPPAPSDEVKLLEEIRDLLKNK
ncbi:MAG: large-conductance mechanosensitive channel protein MscL [Clostridiales bacterium]|jgi:large conductance mechanosensitive channel|nr:large-conductance mechanosensitive channel protein MscL [Clostridiales bacterium]